MNELQNDDGMIPLGVTCAIVSAAEVHAKFQAQPPAPEVLSMIIHTRHAVSSIDAGTFIPAVFLIMAGSAIPSHGWADGM